MTAVSTHPLGRPGPGTANLPAASRTQADRRASTRGALVAATVASLVERGYGGTTTAEVQARAGVSRGALTHHFASKAQLLLAAVEHLYDRMSAQLVEAAADLPEGSERLRPALGLVWSTFDGPLFVAAMELWTAARTDAELREALLPHERRLGGELRELCRLVFGDGVLPDRAPADEGEERLFDVLLTSMRGTAMARWLRPDASSDEPLDAWERLLRAG